MPCLLKQQKPGSPGIITFTHNEVLFGIVSKSKKIRDFLEKSSDSGEWLYGVHIQGDCSHLRFWPYSKWQSFLMWGDPSASWLKNISSEIITSLTAERFLPKLITHSPIKSWDLCIVSRPSTIKRITETLILVKSLIEKKSDLRVIFVVTDPRDQSLGNAAYSRQNIDRKFFDLPRKIFTCSQLKQISFICSSQYAFGLFPVAHDLVGEIIGRSKFLMILSHHEGSPRVIAEAFTQGIPCIVSRNLHSGLLKYLNSTNTVFISDENNEAAVQVCASLENHDGYHIDSAEMQKVFCETSNVPALRAFLSERLVTLGFIVDGNWYMDDLVFRLPCHGQKNNYQFMNDERLFFDWIKKIEFNMEIVLTEEDFFGGDIFVDRKVFEFIDIFRIGKSAVKYWLRFCVRNLVQFCSLLTKLLK